LTLRSPAGLGTSIPIKSFNASPTYKSDDLILSHFVFFEFAQEAAHLDSVAAEEVREPFEHGHYLLAFDPVIQLKEMEGFFHLLFKFHREQLWEVECQFDCFLRGNSILGEQLINALNVGLGLVEQVGVAQDQ